MLKSLLGKIDKKGYTSDVIAILRMNKYRKNKCVNHERIKVVFLCQIVETWNKVAYVYYKMLENPQFDVELVCIPNRIKNSVLENAEDLSNETYDYFISKGYKAINALKGKNEWVDLRELSPDYVFFIRPYNYFMPEIYYSKNISKYAKTCCLLYAINTMQEVKKHTLNKEFFRYIDYYFAESESTMNYNIKQLRLGHILKINVSKYLGSPTLELFIKNSDNIEHSWDFSKNNFRVIWTPRWCTDACLGGSNFFNYYKWLLEYAKKTPEIDFLFRPHPLTFENFLATGEMTQEEVTSFKREIEQIHNVELDTNPQYESTFSKSSVLVSDISSVMVEYFVLGKPIIFCISNMNLELEDDTKKIVEGCYVVNNREELEERIIQLKNGNDYMKEKRQKIIAEVFGNDIQNSTNNIINEIIRNK